MILDKNFVAYRYTQIATCDKKSDCPSHAGLESKLMNVGLCDLHR